LPARRCALFSPRQDRLRNHIRDFLSLLPGHCARSLAVVVPIITKSPGQGIGAFAAGENTMGFASNGQARLYFEAFGPETAPAVLLCGGTGRQLTDYDDEFCDALVSAGYRAIRFDSRDVGLSSSLATMDNKSAVPLLKRSSRQAISTSPSRANANAASS